MEQGTCGEYCVRGTLRSRKARYMCTCTVAHGGADSEGGGGARTIMVTSKEKHSLTRKMVRNRNWRQTWCYKEGNKVLVKE